MSPLTVVLAFSAVNLSIALLIQGCLAFGARSEPRVTEREQYPVADSFSIQYARPALPHNALAAFAALGERVHSHLA